MAVALTKTIRKQRKAHGQTFDCHICNLPQHPLKLISAPQVKKPCYKPSIKPDWLSVLNQRSSKSHTPPGKTI